MRTTIKAMQTNGPFPINHVAASRVHPLADALLVRGRRPALPRGPARKRKAGKLGIQEKDVGLRNGRRTVRNDDQQKDEA
jgi:hypothetical protein